MLTNEDKEALRAMLETLEEDARAKAREEGKLNRKGKILDQTELCYKQYSPPQISNVE